MRTGTFILSFIFSMITIALYSQGDLAKEDNPKPEIGKPMLDFSFNDVRNFEKKRVSVKDFRGKWLFMDFWFPGCPLCIRSFPKINKLQDEFKKDVQFLLVGINYTKYGGTEDFYKRLSKKQNLHLATAFDSVLHVRWDIWSMPHIIIVDPEGIVKAITNGSDMNEAKIKDLITGKDVQFVPKRQVLPDFNVDEAGKNTETLLYRSLLTKWNNENTVHWDLNYYVSLPQEYLKKGFQPVGSTLSNLYKQAYFGQGFWDLSCVRYTRERESGYWDLSPKFYGKVYPEVKLEVRDSSSFKFDDMGNGFYNYSLVMPVSKISRDYIMGVMQRDLKNAFGYDVALEKQQKIVWKLTANSKAKEILKTRGQKPFLSKGSPAAGFTLTNLPVDDFLDTVTSYIGDKGPFYDETGIIGNIDIIVDADLTKFEEVKRELQKHDLDLVKGPKEMDVLVIRDPK